MKPENKFEEVVSRAKLALKLTSDGELATALDMSPTAFSNRRKSGSLPFDRLVEVLGSRNVDIRWVFTGNMDTSVLRDASSAAIEVALKYSAVGSGLLQEMQEASFAERLSAEQLLERFASRLPSSDRFVDARTGPVPEQYQSVPSGSVTLRSGVSVSSNQLVDHLAFKREWLARSLGVSHDDIALVEVRDDSMKGTLNESDVVLVDMRQNKFDASDLYVLAVGSMLLVKRIQHNLDGSVMIKSDNPRYEAATLQVDQLESLNIVGRVVWPRSR